MSHTGTNKVQQYYTKISAKNATPICVYRLLLQQMGYIYNGEVPIILYSYVTDATIQRIEARQGWECIKAQLPCGESVSW